MTIYKYPFAVNDEVTILMPDGAKILHVDCQAGLPCVWAMVDPNKPEVPQHFYIFGTGHLIPELFGHDNHVATFQQGPFVWHMFGIYAKPPLAGGEGQRP